MDSSLVLGHQLLVAALTNRAQVVRRGGVEVLNRTLSFNARKGADGSASGQFEYHQIEVATGARFKFNVDVTCMNVYNGKPAERGSCSSS